MQFSCKVKGCGRKFKSEHALHIHLAKSHHTTAALNKVIGRNGVSNGASLSDELETLQEMIDLFGTLSSPGKVFIKRQLQVGL